MSLNLSTHVVQYTKGTHRHGVIYKKMPKDEFGWTFFEVIWVSGERSVERADNLKTCKSIEDQLADINVLKDLQHSIREFHDAHREYTEVCT